jgi:hypothetical protein
MSPWVLILTILLVVLLIGGLPHWGYASRFELGYFPSGLAGLLLIVVLILALTGRL